MVEAIRKKIQVLQTEESAQESSSQEELIEHKPSNTYLGVMGGVLMLFSAYAFYRAN